LAGLGYDAVELGAELPLAEASETRDLIDDAGLSVSSICPGFTAERDLSHPDPEVRENAVSYLGEVADLANAVGAPVIIVAPTAFLRTRPIASEGEEWGLAVESIRAAGEHAASLGVDLTLECWNRYGTFLLNRLEQAARLWRETGLPNGGVLADTYHMNIEERSLPEAIRTTGTLINHVHLSDSNRAAPGLGHVDYAEVLRALLDIGYLGYLTFELDARAAVRSGVVPAEAQEDPTPYLMEQGIQHLKHLESRF
jgi:sugar phosphate isomerase/epimerase